MTVVDLFRAQAALRHDQVALRSGLLSLTYRELDLQSDRLAGFLRVRGVGNRTMVGLVAERSFDLYIAMLAIAKAGGVFVPLDHRQPAALLRAILKDNDIPFLLAQDRLLDQACTTWFDQVNVIRLSSLTAETLANEPMNCRIAPDDPFYVMFTSGSTGKPKGVIVPHRAVVRLVWDRNFANFGSDEVFCQLAPVDFDASTFEIWGSLLYGACLVIPPPNVPSLDEIADMLRNEHVTTIWMTAALFHLAVDRKIELFAPLKQLLFGGDVISPLRVERLQKMYPALRMVNGYGPTENTTFTTCYQVPKNFVDNGSSLPIGKPIGRTSVYVLDDQMRPVAKGEAGQLCAGGDGVALGYLGQPENNAAKFVVDPYSNHPGARMYLTGDRVRELADGNFEFLGRVDGQVKVQGHRVELDAIESLLRSMPVVREGVAIARASGASDKQIVAFVELQTGAIATERQVRDFLAGKLPNYSVPSKILLVPAMPIGNTGKIDRQALLKLLSTERVVAAPATELSMEQRLVDLWKRLLGRDDIDRDQPFFEQGGTSLQMVEMHLELQTWGLSPISIAELFEYATIRALSERLKQTPSVVRSSAPSVIERGNHHDSIAIIGMGGRFPGANSPAALWKNFVDGYEAIRTFKDEELEDSVDAETRNSGRYVKSRAILDDVASFDAEFFGFYPREAELTDPQQRLLLECAWEALEDAGYAPKAYEGRIGVFAGASINTYLLFHLCSDRKFIEEFASTYQVGSFPTLVGNGADFTASRISYKLDLRGPAFTVQSACSTSLLAVAQACQGLRSGQMDMALAGAASISLPQRRGYLYQEDGMVSPDGHCRPFDAKANGTVFGSGVGLVLLKRYQEAVRDGDNIYALITGVGVSNDGNGKAGFAAPSSSGQAAAITMAHRDAGISADTIDYVECHGTGTPLGDPIEIEALARVFANAPKDHHRCAISSAKSSVGHLDVAAGVTGLMRASLALHNRTIPGTLHYTAPNPRMEIEKTPFYVSAANAPWESNGHPRRAGVSAFGVGGTNVHVVLEEAPEAVNTESSRTHQLLVLSARNPEGLDAARVRLQQHLQDHPDTNLADASYTLAVGRQHFAHRAAVVGRDAAEIAAALKAPQSSTIAKENPSVLFMFPGQGAQYPGMAAGLYASESVFRAAIDECLQTARPYLRIDLKDVLCNSENTDSELLRSTENAQPALFIVEYSLARLWMSWGIQPSVMVGHSVGEVTAACLANVFSLADAIKLVALRGRMMQQMEAGSMLSVRMGEAELLPLLAGLPISLAAVNSSALCVISGPTAAIAALEAEFATRNILAKKLHTSHAFHSAMVDPILPELLEVVRSLTLAAPDRKIISSCTGKELTAAEAQDPAYWTRHCRETVRFAQAVTTAVESKLGVLLEVGPGQTLEMLARQSLKNPALLIAGSLPPAELTVSTNETAFRSLGKLWSAGCDINWSAVFSHEKRSRIPLPTYPFQRKRHWVEAPKSSRQLEKVQVASSGTESQTSVATEDRKPQGSMPESNVQKYNRKSAIEASIKKLFEDLSGVQIGSEQSSTTFIELGFDSLFLTQVTQEIQKQHGVKVTFRQLLGEYSSVTALVDMLDAKLPAEAFAPAIVETTSAPVAIKNEIPATPSAQQNFVPPVAPMQASTGIEGLLREQLHAMSELMRRQLEVLQGGNGVTVSAPATAVTQAAVAIAAAPQAASVSQPPVVSAIMSAAKSNAASELTPQQKKHIDELIQRYTLKTATSKKMTRQYRGVLADPRVVSGFKAEWKEMVYSIITEKSKGSKLWDVDGNEYIDLVNGFGPTMFGHAPDFITKAISEQIKLGFEVGPQSPMAGKVAQLISELTGCERVTFCNTGSEAVMAAMRLARTVTGRDKVVLFSGDYHGQFDEVLVKGVKRNGVPHTLPAAPGIPAKSVENMIVLEYGSNEALDYIRQHASELAAVLVEPVQSRHPNLQPKEFLHEVRRITAESGTALIFDEVVTGFRVHPGGSQAVFGVRADMATYGKVAGGGMPIGLVAGCARFMDALDGGQWNYGDDSAPEVGMTFVAGTFVRHPLTLAATHAALSWMKEQGPELQLRLNERTKGLVARINQTLANYNLPAKVENFGSVFYFNLSHETHFASLLYYHLREKGIHILEGFPCYLTTEHSDADLNRIVEAFDQSLAEMQRDGLLGETTAASKPVGDSGMIHKSPLTEAQLEVMLAAQLSDAGSCAFNESFSLELDGRLNEAGLRDSLQLLLQRHDALRATISPSGDYQEFGDSLQVEMPLVDLSSLDATKQAESLGSITEREAVMPFDLHKGPLFRMQCVRLGADRHLLVVTAHHIVCDGWSVNVLLDELGQIYSSKVTGKSIQLAPALSFGKFAQELLKTKDSAEQKETEQYWTTQFQTIPALLDLPTDSPRPSERSYRGNTYYAELPKHLNEALRAFSATQHCTKFVTLLGGFQLLLSRLSQQDETVVLVPSAAQSQVQDAVLVGHGVNLLPIRSHAEAGMTASEYLKKLNEVVLDAYDHQSYTFGTLVHKLGAKREPGRLPLSEIQFNVERVGQGLHFEGLKSSAKSNGKRFVNFDLFLNVVDTGSELRLECDYNSDVFEKSTVARWMDHYRTLLEAMVASAQQPVHMLPLLNQQEREHILVELNQTVAAYPSDKTLPMLISEQAALSGGKIAVRDENERFTYTDLERRAGQIASMLIKLGVRPNDMVGVLVDRSAGMVAALLGVLKAGASYVPLDPIYPKSRIDFILNETQVPVLITLQHHLQDVPVPDGTQVICLDRDAAKIKSMPVAGNAQTTSDSLAYVIYTSGSTGQPKGVEISHRALVNLLVSAGNSLGVTESDRLLAVTTVSFDIAGLELFMPLLRGAEVIIALKDDLGDGKRLSQLIDQSHATMMQGTPATWKLLLEAQFQPVKGFKVMCGGEAWSRELADRLLACGCQIWNMYGPTETTIWSSITPVEAGTRPPSIRSSVANTTFYVLDSRKQPVPFGVPGELYIGGDGVARGYYRRPELTASRFVKDPFATGERRIYATGDRVRQHNDGAIEFLGRSDFQVKIRGFRIELGDIESAFVKVTGISESVAVARDFGADDKRLLLYYVASESLQSLSEVRNRMRELVPDYMIPAMFVRLDAFPLTDNGKIDRKGLPAPSATQATFTTTIRKAETANQLTLTQICSEVLGLPVLGVDEDLIDLGADSIHIFQMTARAIQQGLPLSAKLLWSHRTVEKICAALSNVQTEQQVMGSAIRPNARDRYRVSVTK